MNKIEKRETEAIGGRLVSEIESDCPSFGTAFDPNEEACQKCGIHFTMERDACRRLTEAANPPEESSEEPDDMETPPPPEPQQEQNSCPVPEADSESIPRPELAPAESPPSKLTREQRSGTDTESIEPPVPSPGIVVPGAEEVDPPPPQHLESSRPAGMKYGAQLRAKIRKTKKGRSKKDALVDLLLTGHIVTRDALIHELVRIFPNKNEKDTILLVGMHLTFADLLGCFENLEGGFRLIPELVKRGKAMRKK